MTYFGAAAAALAVVVSAVALFLAVTTKNDAATKDDLDQLTERVDGLKQSVTAATEKQLKATSETLGSLDQRIEALSSAQKQDAADIADLQSSQSATTGKNSGADKTGLGGGTGANSNNPGP
jgi:septal ring factor EnvC (AmiA/AmiB activator)